MVVDQRCNNKLLFRKVWQLWRLRSRRFVKSRAFSCSCCRHRLRAWLNETRRLLPDARRLQFSLFIPVNINCFFGFTFYFCRILGTIAHIRNGSKAFDADWSIIERSITFLLDLLAISLRILSVLIWVWERLGYIEVYFCKGSDLSIFFCGI